MSTNAAHAAPPATGFAALIRSEYPLIIGLGTAAVFLALGSRVVENVEQPFALAGVFALLFITVLWSAISVVRHADVLAVKCGEPYGTLILTLSAITIEVMMISAAVLHGANNPTLARDMMFAVVMIVCNGLVGLCLLSGGVRHHEQGFQVQGASAALSVLAPLTILTMVVPNFTVGTPGPTFSTSQLIFAAIISLVLYGSFVFVQTLRHRDYFLPPESGDEAHASPPPTNVALASLGLLLVSLAAIVGLAKALTPAISTGRRYCRRL
jgi:Ca2+:H+ antiporter